MDNLSIRHHYLFGHDGFGSFAVIKTPPDYALERIALAELTHCASYVHDGLVDEDLFADILWHIVHLTAAHGQVVGMVSRTYNTRKLDVYTAKDNTILDTIVRQALYDARML